MKFSEKYNSQKNSHSAKKTKLSLRPLNANIRMLLAGSIVLGSLTLSSHANAALPLPKPAGAWATARSPLPRVSSASGWAQVNADLWRSGTTEAQFSDKTLTVKQTEGRVILSWDSFDIDVSHLVEFKQPDSNSIALNRIINSASPSKILGTLKANGQVYLINNNGFLFGANSVIDVNSLVVSTLDVSDDVFNRGIFKVFDESDAGAAFTGNGEVYLRDPASGDYVTDANGNRMKIGIYVEEGAKINTDNYGRVIMVAPEIINNGAITSPDGQVVMAAATDRVYLQESSDESVRGLLVEVGTGGVVSNGGVITTPRGNTTLMGFAVNQEGIISASTSVRVNGSIRLLARENAPTTPKVINKKNVLEATSTTRARDLGDGLGTVAKVHLGEDSITAVIPEIEDKSTAVAEQAQPASSVEIMGQTVHFKSDSAVIAPSGKVDVVATETPNAPEELDTENSSSIIMDSGSIVDVAGLTSAERSMESNVIEVETRSNEFADAPVQKNGFLHGKKLRIDIREGTPIANIQAALDSIKSTVEERSVEGGTVNFSSQGTVTLNENSTVDISGGAIHYREGYIDTTQLVGVDGNIYDISEASPDLEYIGILGEVSKEYKKWGVTKSWKVAGPFNRGRFESAYTDGQAAGTFNINAHALVQNGDIVANTINGRRQRRADQRARGGSLNVDLSYRSQNYQALVFQNNKNLNSPNLEELDQNGNSDQAAPASLIIEGDYFKRNGLQNVNYVTRNKIVISNDADMQLANGGKFSLTGTDIDVNGKIEGHGADISMTATLGDIVLSENTVIDTSGGWVNDSPVIKPEPDFEPVFIDAGGVDITSQLANVIMEKGSIIRANGGAWLNSENKLETGKGGDVSLSASTLDNGNGSLFLNGVIEGFSFEESGALALTANEFRFSPAPGGEADSSTLNPVYIPQEFVEQGGFSNYIFNSNRNGITFEKGALLKPSRENLVLNSRDIFLASSTMDVASVSTRQRLPDEIRQPVNLDFKHAASFAQAQDRAIHMLAGSRILAEPGAKVSFSSSTSLFMNGVVDAPAGEIALTITDPSGRDQGYIPEQGIWLGKDSLLSTAGVFIPNSNPVPGVRDGELYDGGKIMLEANRGFILMDDAAAIDVSGADALIDLPDADYQGPGMRLQETAVASDAGEVSLVAAEGIIAGGNIIARANEKQGAEGGRLDIEFVSRSQTNIDLAGTGATPFIETPRKIIVGKEKSQPANALPEQGEAIADEVNGYAWLDSKLLNDSGFASIGLKAGSVVFDGGSSIVAKREIRLDSSRIVWQSDASNKESLISLVAPYVALGASSRQEADDAIRGDGRLLVEANMIELPGATSLQGFDQVELNSHNDIRLRGYRKKSTLLNIPGELNSRGELILAADSVYPATLTDYTIKSDDVTIRKHAHSAEKLRAVFSDEAIAIMDKFSQSDEDRPILSAGGRVQIEADTITQAGELRAPLGEISLSADSVLSLEAGSLTSTSADGQIIPFGRTSETGLDWQYDFADGDTLRITRPPEKRILLSSDDVRFNEGAVIDMSGGGDLQAWEFVSGPGGTRDIFAGDTGSFAVIPAYTNYAPYDEGETKTAGFRVGDTVYLSGVGDLPSGEYALLPARYALLDGAYLVTPREGFSNITPGTNSYLTDKTPVVAGQYRLAGSDAHAQTWNGFSIETSAQARRRVEILLSRANRYYTDKALANETLIPFLPEDAGQLGISALSQLDLAGELRSDAVANARGGRLDIEATNLAVVNQRSVSGENDDRVELLAEELNSLDMESLLLGGVRKQTDSGTEINVVTQTLTLETNSSDDSDSLNLSGTEILMAAQDRIDLNRGVNVRAEGEGGISADTLLVNGDGALMRVSAGEQVKVSRTGSRGDTGVIDIHEGARLASNSAMLLDASHETTINGQLEINNGSLNIGAGRINLGNAPISATGLLLDRDLLNSLSLSELVMTGREGVYVYGDVDFNFDNIVFDSAGIVSQGNGDNRFTVNADSVRFTNSTASVDLVSGSDDVFTVNAREIEFGKGDYMLSGFDSVAMNASEQIIGSGETNFTINADVNLNAPLISSRNGANTNIDVSTYQFSFESPGTAGSISAAGFGGRLSVTAQAINDRGAILLPSGTLEFNAVDGVFIDDALVDVSGVSKSFRGEIKTASAGNVILTSEQGNVELSQTARINLSAADEGGDAGLLEVNTLQGEFVWQGDVSATSEKGKGGRLVLNTERMSDVFSVFNRKLADAGFDEALTLRLSEGDIALVETDALRAHELTLTADSGNITVDGVIDARGDNGGRVILSAGDNIEVNGRIDARATARDGDGGSVQLATIDNDNDGLGEINVNGEIDVSGGVNGKGGDVGYRARRIDSNNDGLDDEIAIANAGTVIGAATVNYEAVRVYEDVARITQAQWRQWQRDTQNYMNFSGAIDSRLNANSDVNGRILPGLEIRSRGDMRIDADIDFSSWRYGENGTPGVATLSAEGDLLINRSISDGLFSGSINTEYGAIPVNDFLMTDESWSYRLLAGADRQSAHVMDINKGIGDINLSRNTKVRTGTGFIDIAGGNDLVLGNDASVIYTAGRASETNRWGDMSDEMVAFVYYSEYPTEGGDIRINVGGDFQGAVSEQSIRDWLMSTGSWSRAESHSGEMPTAWGIALTQTNFTGNAATSAFRRGVGALGGGDVSINVAGDMQDVSVMMPTSGKPMGESLSLDPTVPDFSENRVKITGGGQLNIAAGGDINGGVFYLGEGKGDIRTGGGLLAGDNGVYPVLAMGDTRFSISSKNSLGIGAVYDPLIEQPTFNSAGNTYFFTYSDSSSLSLTSVAGDVVFYNDGNDNQIIYPASLSAGSLTGDIVIDKGFTLFPSAIGQLELLAANDIFATPTTEARIFMSDADPSLVPNADYPDTITDSRFLERFNPFERADLIHAETPLHINDETPVRIIAENGSISSPGNFVLNLPKKAEVYASEDIRNTSFIIQNINLTDRTRITAGRDFSYEIPRLVDGGVQSKDKRLQVSGPGELVVQAGRNIDLGTSAGIETIGNTKNPVLMENGADLVVIAGVKGNIDYAGFSEAYIQQNDKYLAAVKTFVDTGVIDFDQDGSSAYSTENLNAGREQFSSLDEQKQSRFLRELFLREIRDVGVKSAEEGSGFYQPAYDAIATLFPDSYAGNINLFFSKIQTIDGGNIQLLTPGGGVNAGLATSAGLSKDPSELGIVAQREGRIDAYVRDDFQVNLSRVFTLAGGDIMLFAEQGNIDAGRGAKTALAAPPPRISYDENSNLIVEYPNAIQGSGIRTVATGDGEAGDVYLFAPQGAIDAGDAGINSGGRGIVDAPIISDNISIDGASIGLPTASVSLAAGLTGVSNLSASSSKVAEESTSSIGKTSEEAGFADSPMGFLNIELLGFGGDVTMAAPRQNINNRKKF